MRYMVHAYSKIEEKRAPHSGCRAILVSVDSPSNWEATWMRSLRHHCADKPFCQDTLTCEGKRFQRYSLWYFLYGEAARLCNEFRMGDPIATLQGGLTIRSELTTFGASNAQQIRNKVAVARHYYDGSPLADQETSCRPSTFPVGSVNIQNWDWTGVRKW